jgi:hypothetical protein
MDLNNLHIYASKIIMIFFLPSTELNDHFTLNLFNKLKNNLQLHYKFVIYILLLLISFCFKKFILYYIII